MTFQLTWFSVQKDKSGLIWERGEGGFLPSNTKQPICGKHMDVSLFLIEIQLIS